jgi:hypothetical protein
MDHDNSVGPRAGTTGAHQAAARHLRHFGRIVSTGDGTSKCRQKTKCHHEVPLVDRRGINGLAMLGAQWHFLPFLAPTTRVYR